MAGPFAKVTWSRELEELRAQLRSLPADLAAEAGHIVEARANAAAFAIRSAYPVGPSGNLVGKVQVTHGTGKSTGQYGAGAVVINTAKHASIFEYGTVARAYTTASGAVHRTGIMPAGNVFVPRIIEHRRAMYAELAAMLERHGLRAVGSFDFGVLAA